MKIKIAVIVTACLAMASTLSYSQALVNISGRIMNKGCHPLQGVTVHFNPLADSMLLTSTLTNTDGLFIVNNLKNGLYRFTINMIGYVPYTNTIRLDKTLLLPAITLIDQEKALKEVKITAYKPLVEQKIDRTIINVDANIANAGSNLMEVLEKSPGVMVDQNGIVSLKGKGATIFIDDKPTYLSGADLNAYLSSLPSSTIDQIELMTNPPARYDASGNGGIINIRTKKGKIKGINGGINLSYLQGRYARTNNSFNFNYRNNKINLFGNLSYSTVNFYSDMDFYRHYTDVNGDVLSNFLQNSYTRRKSQSTAAKVGLDYYISDQTTIGLSLTGLYKPSTQTAPVNSIFANAQNQHDSTVNASNSDNGNFKKRRYKFKLSTPVW